MKSLRGFALLVAAALAVPACLPAAAQAQSGLTLVLQSLRRYAEPPAVYTEETLVLSDAQGRYTVRTLRHYLQSDANGVRSLRVIRTPEELRGIEVLVTRDARTGGRRGDSPGSHLFGSDFSVADLEPEQPGNFRYERLQDTDLDRVPHHVVRAVPRDDAVARAIGLGERRIYLRRDNLYVSRIDFLDRQGHVERRETFRDPQPDESGLWRADMVMMENLRENRRSLLKVDRRVHSADYVPPGVFAGLQ